MRNVLDNREEKAALEAALEGRKRRSYLGDVPERATSSVPSRHKPVLMGGIFAGRGVDVGRASAKLTLLEQACFEYSGEGVEWGVPYVGVKGWER